MKTSLYKRLIYYTINLKNSCKFTTKSFLTYEWFNHAIYSSKIIEADKTDKVTFEIPIEQLISDLTIQEN